MKPSYTTEEKDGYEIRTYDNGSKGWYKNGKRHREDGPAYEWTDGSKGWYLDGYPVSEVEWKRRMLRKKIENILDKVS